MGIGELDFIEDERQRAIFGGRSMAEERRCQASMQTAVARLRSVKYDPKKNMNTLQFDIPADPAHLTQLLKMRDQMCYLSCWRYIDQGALATEQIPADRDDEAGDDTTPGMFE